MKTKQVLFLLAFVAALVVALCKAAPSLITGGFTTVNNTTNDSPAVSVGSIINPRGTFVFGNNGLTATTALTNLVQLSLDRTNWLTVGTYNPAGTNATNEAFTLPAQFQTLYLRVRSVTTNSVQLTAIYQP